MGEQVYESAYEWLDAFDALKTAGHDTSSKDDADARELGFFDHTTGTWHHLRVVLISRFGHFPKPDDMAPWLEKFRRISSHEDRERYFGSP